MNIAAAIWWRLWLWFWSPVSSINSLDVAYTSYILLYYFSWQTYHYMRQNYGILAFVSAATDTVRLHWLEKVILKSGSDCRDSGDGAIDGASGRNRSGRFRGPFSTTPGSPSISSCLCS